MRKIQNISKLTFTSTKIFDKSYTAIDEINSVLRLNTPIYVEFAVLELSKWLIYHLHYNFIEKYFDFELLFSDTDSLAYKIKSKDVYVEFFKHKHLFVLRKYRKNSNFFDSTNNKVIRKMKDVSEGKINGEDA